MSVLAIHPVDHPMLRRKASRVGRVTSGIRGFVDDMFETMDAHHGAGLAAPQVGRPWRVIVVNAGGERFSLINPQVVRSRGSATADEGCLSLPNWYGPVERATDLTVKGLDVSGAQVRHRLFDLVSRVLLHEIDHLDGVIFTDRLVNVDRLRFVDPNSVEARGLHLA
jgi:peptide deformylase